ncbi:Helix-turn-helix protein [Lunatimonas lonarensis]|uniref:Helix-turn-helix protein n=1 Tax=Lunatimonas lonarensis TaxID=1232681 RepID=R7ZNT9_9BACT|nr:helix-turn-helix transcriptional regulator [Lunatimonas lonarensis]EON75747.1 Helix-turn-helix protein [Lunatimonas lonarensis]
MNKIEKRIKALASENPVSQWREKVAFRKANRSRLKDAARVALRILDALEEKGWSQAQLAKALEVTPQQVSKLLKGQSDYKFSTIEKLEGALGIKLHVVLADNEFVTTEEAFEQMVQEEVMAYRRTLGKSKDNLKSEKPT